MLSGAEWGDRLAGYAYRLEGIGHISGPAAMYRHEPECYTLLFVNRTTGEWKLDGCQAALERHCVYAVPPHSDIVLIGQVDLHAVRFHALHSAEPGRPDVMPPEFPGKRRAAHYPMLAGKLEQLLRMQRSGWSGWDRLRANVLFQELLISAYERTGDDELLPEEWNPAIPMTVRYMEEHFGRRITRDQLANMVGLNADYYSRMFNVDSESSFLKT